MVRDSLEHVAQVALRIEAIELGGAEETVDRGGPLATVIGSSEQPVLPFREILP
jgi:hypothetical protein